MSYSLIESQLVASWLLSLASEGNTPAGSVNQGSTSSVTSIVIGRNTSYLITKTEGNGSRKSILFTGAHRYYSLEKATWLFLLKPSSRFPLMHMAA